MGGCLKICFSYGEAVSRTCRPGRCGMRKIEMTISTARTAEAFRSPTASPPWPIGLSKELAIVAPNGRVRIKAAQCAGNPRKVVENGNDGEDERDHKRAVIVAQSGIGHPVAKRSAERLREHDRGPVKGLDFRRGDGLYGDRTERK